MNKIYQSNWVFSTLILIFYITLCLLLQNFIIYDDIVLADKNDEAKRGGVRQMLTGLTKGGGGLGKC